MFKSQNIATSKEGLRVLLAAMLAMSTLGFIYIWSVFIAPLENDPGWSREELSLVFTFAMAFLTLGVMSGGYFLSRFNTRRLLIVCLGMVFSSFIISSYTNSIVLLYVFYGGICGFFMGIVYNGAFYICNLWFLSRFGLVSGLLQGSFGIGAVILGYVATNFLDNYDWRTTMRLLGSIFFLLFLPVVICLKKPATDHLSVAAKDLSASAPQYTPDIPWRQTTKTPSFWLFWIARIFILAGGLGLIGHAMPLAIDMGSTVYAAVLAMGILSFGNAAGRVSFGLLSDFLSLKKVLLLICLSYTLAFTLLILSSIFRLPLLIVPAFLLCGLAYGGITTTSSIFARTMFGVKYFAQNYGLTSSATLISSFIGPYAVGEIHATTFSYNISFYLFIVLGLVSTSLILSIKEQ